MPKSHEKPLDNTEVIYTELDLSADRLCHYLNTNKNVTIKNLQDNYAEIITQNLKDLLPPESAARLGICMLMGRLKRQGKIEVFHDTNTNQDRVCLTGDRIFKTKWMSAIETSPNMF
jgi:hypothetical protein